MKDFEKMRKYLQRDFELMIVLYIIFSIPELLVGITAVYIGIRLAVIILLGFGINFAIKGEKTAGIFGIIVSILMMLSNSILLGGFMLIQSIIFLTNYIKLKK